jgi:hypothetical protein
MEYSDNDRHYDGMDVCDYDADLEDWMGADHSDSDSEIDLLDEVDDDGGSIGVRNFMKFSSLPKEEELWIVDSCLVEWDNHGRPGKRQAFQVALPNNRYGWVKMPHRFLPAIANFCLGDTRFTTLTFFGVEEFPTRYRFAVKPLGEAEIGF